MKSYSLKCKKDTENINPRVSNTGNGKTILLSKYTKLGSKSRFSEGQAGKRLLSDLGIRIPFSKVSLLGNILF